MSNRNGRRRNDARRRGSGHPSATLESTYFGASGRCTEFSSPQIQRKDLQLCRQVHEQLDLVVAELDDPLLGAVSIAEVSPQGDAHLLRVVVVAPRGADVLAITRRLEAARSTLRAEVAAAIHRKRTPHLSFVVLTAEMLGYGGDDDHRE